MSKLSQSLELSGEFQRKCGDFVARHVHQCCSTMVYDLLRSEEAMTALELSYEDGAAICNAELEASDYADQWSGPDYLKPIEVTGGWDVRDSDDDTLDSFDDELEAWQFAYEQEGQDEPVAMEALEHWLISRDLAYWLQKQGQAVSTDFAGLCIWGRTTSGQAIAMDHCITSIVAGFMTDEEREAMAVQS